MNSELLSIVRLLKSLEILDFTTSRFASEVDVKDTLEIKVLEACGDNFMQKLRDSMDRMLYVSSF